MNDTRLQMRLRKLLADYEISLACFKAAWKLLPEEGHLDVDCLGHLRIQKKRENGPGKLSGCAVTHLVDQSGTVVTWQQYLDFV